MFFLHPAVADVMMTSFRYSAIVAAKRLAHTCGTERHRRINWWSDGVQYMTLSMCAWGLGHLEHMLSIKLICVDIWTSTRLS